MNPLVRIGGRHFLRHRAQLALAVFGVGIGVAAVVAIGLANESAARAFYERNSLQPEHRVLSVSKHRESGHDMIRVADDGVMTEVKP